jgi:ubiquinone/menaquinone biosynthesis C-methylase UbiE
MKMGSPARIFALVLRIAPPFFKNKLWKWWYQRLAKGYDKKEFRFMNYGYKDDGPLILSDYDESHRLFIQLYNTNIKDIDFKGKNVLEVGSGRGGGASWIARTKKPESLTGIDFSKEAVSLCNIWYKDQKNLSFIEGNAENIPLKNSSFDIVYNVESSHCYGNISKFIQEVFRLLKNQGDFCWTDFRDQKTMTELENIFISVGFKIISKRNITKQVLEALDMINESKKEKINQLVPKSIRRSFETFAGVQGTPVYQAFVEERLQYYCYQLKKIS